MVLELKNGKMCFDEELLLHIRSKKNDIVQSLLSSDELRKAIDATGATLLHFACQYGNDEITQYLIDYGADVNVQDELGRTPLLLAVTSNEAEISEKTIQILLLATADFLKADVRGEYPLKRVVDSQNFDNVEVFIDFGKRLQEYCQNDAKLMADLLIKAGCPLERAIYLGNAMVTEFMIEAGCDIDAQHPFKRRTALHTAAWRQDWPNIQMLINYGADATIKVGAQFLPLIVYMISCLRPNQPSKPKLEIIQCLTSQYFNSADKTHEKELSMSCLLRFGDEETIRYVLQYDIDMSMKDRGGKGVLHLLAMNSNPNVLRPFEGKIIDVNVCTLDGMTPLHCASSACNVGAVKFLLNNGANVNAKNIRGQTPLSNIFDCIRPISHPAREKEIVEILLEHGADIQVASPARQEKILDSVVESQMFHLGEVLVAKLVLQEKLGEPIIGLIRSKIDAHQQFKSHYDLCQEQLEDMKKVVLYESITVYKLLMQSEEEIVKLHAYNEELIIEFENFDAKYCLNFNYYYNILRIRLTSALPKIKLIQGATKIIFDQIIPKLNNNYLIARQIIDYLDYKDMKVLNKI